MRKKITVKAVVLVDETYKTVGNPDKASQKERKKKKGKVLSARNHFATGL